MTRLGFALVTALGVASTATAGTPDLERLVAALLGTSPLEEDLRVLTDEIGGRPTGSEANRRSVEWALARFREADVPARAEAFTMPALWLGRSTRAAVRGDVGFEVRAAAMPFTPPTPPGGVAASLVDGGRGTEADFARLGGQARGALVLIETEELRDVEGLFREYAAGKAIEDRARGAGAAGVAYMASRPRDVLYRHNASQGPANTLTLLVLEREGAERAARLLRAGRRLELVAEVDAETGGPYESENVIGEIRGSERPDEVVLLGAHLDSWDLGTGALDDGCNVAMLIDVARQIRRLGLVPRRTLRFALWNGEEQGMHGSWGYTRTHADELDRHVMAAAFDIGSGRISGFFTNGRAELVDAVDRALAPVRGLGPFASVNEPIVGTDNYDFMLEGVANLVANQESANYGPNYHAASDTFDKVDLRQLRQNAAVAAALAWGFSEGEAGWGRHTRAEVESLVVGTSLEEQMKAMGAGLWEQWASGRPDAR